MGRARHSGQSTVEAVGLTLVVAALLAALALWAGRAGTVPSAAPVRLDPLTGLLAESGEGSWTPGAPGFFLGTLRRGDPPIGRVLRGVAHVVRIGAPAFAEGAADRLRERLRALVRHPIATVRETIRTAARDAADPIGVLRARLGGLVDYVRSLRGLTRDEIVRRIAHDLGGTATDVVISRLVRLARMRIARGITDRAGGGVPPTPPSPPAPATSAAP